MIEWIKEESIKLAFFLVRLSSSVSFYDDNVIFITLGDCFMFFLLFMSKKNKTICCTEIINGNIFWVFFLTFFFKFLENSFFWIFLKTMFSDQYIFRANNIQIFFLISTNSHNTLL